MVRKISCLSLVVALLFLLAPMVYAAPPPPPEGEAMPYSPEPKAVDEGYIAVVQPEQRMARFKAMAEGGPDGFGYTFIDSKETGGPVFNWIEIDRTGTRDATLSNADDYGVIVDLGFPFKFYGETFTDTIGVSTNGYLSFDKHLYRIGPDTIALLTDFSNDPIPFPFDPDALIAPFWDDLHTGLSGDIYYQTFGVAPNRFLVVEWQNVGRWSGLGTRNTFQVILYEGSNDILFQYLTQSGAGASGSTMAQGGSATIGLEDFGPYPDTTDGGLSYSYNTAVLSDGLAILFECPNATVAGDPHLDDWFESTYGVSAANADGDGDGLSNLQEQQARTDPTKADTDGDGADDSAEVTAGTLGYYPDSDNDQLPDGYELTHTGFDPLDPDVDDDGLVDGLEGLYNCDPFNANTDNDKLPDGWEVMYIADATYSAVPLMFPDNQDGDRDGMADWAEDPDGDGLENEQEYQTGADPTLTDTDGDGLTDQEEYVGADGFAPGHASDTLDRTDPTKTDTDDDGIDDDEEVVAGADGFVTKAANPDTDSDGLPDGWETRFGLDPTNPGGGGNDNGADGNPDNDGLTNIREYQYHTFPTQLDSDQDGRTDGQEVDVDHTDPTGENFDNSVGTGDCAAIAADGCDTDKDGVMDGHEYNGVDNNPATPPGNTDQTDPKNPDSDGDGMPDGFEYTYSAAPVLLDPNSDLTPGVTDWDKDPDADQLNNREEYLHMVRPDVADTDSDGQKDGVEVSGSGIPKQVTFADRSDSDEDGLSDKEETSEGDDGYVTQALNPDSDGDFLTDGQEYRGADGNPGTDADRTKPLNKDTDGGGAFDGWEVYWGFDALSNTDDVADTDSDNLINALESQYPRDTQRYPGISGFVTNPNDTDTDDDSRLDGEERAAGSNPTLPDSDGGGAWDPDEALIIPPDTTSSSLDAMDPSDDHLRRFRDTMRHENPEVAVDSQNYAHIIWRERVRLADGFNGADLFYAMTNPDGTYRIAPTRITGYLAADVPQVVIDANDIVHVVWEDERWDRAHDEILYMQFDPSQDDQNGDAASMTAIQTSDDTYITQYQEIYQTEDLGPVMALDAAGDIHLAWHQVRGNNLNRLMYLRFDPDTPATPEVSATEVAITNIAGWPHMVSLAVDSANDPHLVWYNWDQELPAYNDTDTYELYYAMLGIDGTPLISPTLITSDDNKASLMPDVVVDSNDLVNVVWTDSRLQAEEIFYMRLDPTLDDQDGSPADLATIQVVAPFALTANNNSASRHAACALSGSELHVLWFDLRNDPLFEAFYGRYDISAAGDPTTIGAAEVRLEVGTVVADGNRPGLALDSSKLAHGVWTAARPDPEPGFTNVENVQHLAHRFDRVLVDHFTFAAIGNQMAGVNFTIQITAENAANQTVTEYSDQADLSVNAGGSIMPSTVNFVNGVAQLSVKIANPATDVRITAADGAVTGQSNAFNVFALDHFAFDSIGNQVFNVPFSITVRAIDNTGAPMVISQTVTLADSTGTLAPTTVAFANESSRTLNVTIGITDTDVVITATWGAITGTSNLFDVTDAPSVHHFAVATIASPQAPGRPFSITITAQDATNQTVGDYNGTANLTINAGGAILPNQAAFVNGVATLSVRIQDAAEDVVITVTDGSVTGQSNPFDVAARQAIYLPLVLRSNTTVYRARIGGQ